MTEANVSADGGLVRPDFSAADAERTVRECYGIVAQASELGSNQDRNFALLAADGSRYVLRVDHPIFSDASRDAQHAALDAYRAAGVTVPAVLPGRNGELTQRASGLADPDLVFAVRLSEFAQGEPMVDSGYIAPVVMEEFGELAADSVMALAHLAHPGLEREHMWVMSVAHEQTVSLAPAIADADLREHVLEAAAEAAAALSLVAPALPRQAIHGDLTDDNVTGVRGDDSRLHPHAVLDLGDLAYGWRVSELAVTLSSLLHHEADRPLRALDAIAAFHRKAPLTVAEALALWPLVVLRGAVLVASGWRQLEIDGGNDYARDRISGEQAIFDAAVRYPLAEMTEQVLARLGMQGVASGSELQLLAAPSPVGVKQLVALGTSECRLREMREVALGSLLPGLNGAVAIVDPGVESDALEAGRWLAAESEELLVRDALSRQATGEVTFGCAPSAAADLAAAAVFPYGVYRLTRTTVDSSEAAATWPLGTEIVVRAGESLTVTAPVAARIAVATDRGVLLEIDEHWFLSIDGVDGTCEEDASVQPGQPIAVLEAADELRPIAVTLCRADALGAQTAAQETAAQVAPILALDVPDPGRAQLIAPERVAAWQRFTADPAAFLNIAPHAQRDESGDELARRGEIFASAQERYYERPMQIERGWRHHLIDTTGRAYVDMVNNVTGLGHGHPGVAAAASRQIRILNTNSRFLYRELAEYSERLLAMLPTAARAAVPASDDAPGRDAIDTVLLVNSGSEAVDLALRLAQAASGKKTVVALREAYHGWTMASDGVTTSAYDNPFALENRPDWVHVADVPNRFRGTYRGEAADPTVGAAYAHDLETELAELARSGRSVAGFICESVLGNAGGVMLPTGYLSAAYDLVRRAGGLCIADEVQVGFGRMGSTFWGFEQSGVVPDIITIAKPMGNGFPIGGVLTSKRIADALATQGQFFASTGGNPLSCRVGIAVLDAMAAEGLQENARVVGDRLAAGFRALAEKHDLIGPVHGEGLYLGVELVRDRETMEPAKAETAAICERLRELGVVVLSTSERSNVLKVKPPLCLTPESADFVVAAVDRVLTEGW